MKMLVACSTVMALLLTLAVSLMISGCAGGNLPESQRIYYLQENFGRSVKTVNHNQTLNPAAGTYPVAVEGLDGRTADMAAEKHRETFSKEYRQDRGDHREQITIFDTGRSRSGFGR